MVMERYWIWYALQLKAWCKTRVCWLQIAGMLFVVYVILHITLPSQETVRVGLCGVKDGYAEEIAKLLTERESVFSFTEYTDEKALGEDVARGITECGFVFLDDFEERFSNAKINHCVKYMETPFTTKGKVAKETFYASFFQVYGRVLLKNQVPEIFSDGHTKMQRLLLEKNQEYRDSDVVFSAEIRMTDTALTEGESSGGGKCYPVQGCIGIFLFVILLTAYGKSFEHGNKVKDALGSWERSLFEFFNYSAVTLPAAAAGTAAIFFSGASRGGGTETIRMLSYIAAGSLWMLLFKKLWRNRSAFAAWMAVLVMMQALVYPVFFDFSEYVPFLCYVRLLFPMLVYL